MLAGWMYFLSYTSTSNAEFCLPSDLFRLYHPQHSSLLNVVFEMVDTLLYLVCISLMSIKVSFKFTYLFVYSVCIYESLKTICGNWFSPPVLVPEVRFRWAALVASTFIHWAVSMAPFLYPYLKFMDLLYSEELVEAFYFFVVLFFSFFLLLPLLLLILF